MIAFEIYVNKVKACTAGIENFDLISSTLLCTSNQDGWPDASKLVFSVAGVADKQVFKWVQYDMYVGSRVEIRFVETEQVDIPKKLECPGGSCAV